MLVWATDPVKFPPVLLQPPFIKLTPLFQLLFDILSGYSITAPTIMCEHLIFHMQEKFGFGENDTELDSEYSGIYFVYR